MKHAQGIFEYFSSIAQSKSLKFSPLGSTGSVKYLVPTQLSSTTTVAPTDSAMLCTFQLGTAIGEPEIMILGASLLATPMPSFLRVVQFIAKFVYFCGEPFDVIHEANLVNK